MQLRRALFITFFSSNAANAVQFAVVVVLSRLLTPAEVGIYSITAVFVAITIVFRDFGVSTYLQREKDLTPEKTRSALGLLITSSWMLAAFLYFSSDYVAAYYAQPGIGRALRVLTLSFLIVPFASFVSSLLARELQAGKAAIATGLGTIAYAATCITMAYMGFSYMSLAWANVANLAVTLLVYTKFIPAGTSFKPSFKGWRAPAQYGGGAVLGTLVDRLNYAIPDLVIGKISGTTAVGLYSRAGGLVGLFQQVIGPMVNYSAVPFIASNHHKNNPLTPLISKAISYLTCLAWPAYIVIGLFSEPIIKVLYGAQWISAAPIVLLLCIQAAVRTGFSLVQPLLLAIGKPYISAITSGSTAIARLALIFLLGSTDLYDIVVAICIADCLSAFISVWVLVVYADYSLKDLFLAHWGSLKVTVVVLVAGLAMHEMIPASLPSYVTILAVSAVCGTVWLSSIYYFNHAIKDEWGDKIKKIKLT
ncbi:oligosaccharide flippase family protein [Rhodoferax sp. U11-2br]|uniref:oligosaccharide flippase family protein n=1 Tax=Rhodoferax sp. U11-2br TaxID=2838878 RepID=UPI001BEA89B7|nr:oligosaccharide flippase family protein [Rhodoferax sp. U11-2br]MBT3067049.1 oligosaccharide flippase family protein [Rhodoferax sp. U11-2br]